MTNSAIKLRRHRARNPEMYRLYRRRSYQKHRLRRIQDARDAQALRQAFVDAARAGGCIDCGIKNLGVLQSDHVRGQKIYEIARMVRSAPLPRLFAELDKCETVCANCHQLRTASRAKGRGWTPSRGVAA